MVYGVHDFYHNYCNAAGANDADLQRTMLINEVTKVIADNKQGFINALNASGIKTSKRPGNSELAKAFLNNLKNQKLQQNIGVLVLQHNNIPLTSVIKKQSKNSNLEMLNADGSSVNSGIPTQTPATDAIGLTLDDISQTLSNDKSGKQKTEIHNEILNSIMPEPGKINLGKIIFWAGVLGTAAYFTYKYYKRKTT